jgi:putative oxidoreductase
VAQHPDGARRRITPTGPQFGSIGYEMNVLYLACLAALVLGGPGPFALDSFLRARRTSER